MRPFHPESIFLPQSLHSPKSSLLQLAFDRLSSPTADQFVLSETFLSFKGFIMIYLYLVTN